MSLHKTPKARELLAGNSQSLSQAERRILILCDGRRSRDDIVRMLGPECIESMQLLQAQGFLSESVTNATPAASQRKCFGLGQLLGNRSDESHAATRTASPPLASPPSQAAATSIDSPAMESPTTSADAPIPNASRRSLAACKMYMLDMLQLQRSMESSALAVDIQTSAGPHELVEHLLMALRHLCEATKPSMAARIAERLKSTLPELHLPRMERELAMLFPPLGSAEAEAAGHGNVVQMRRDVA